jgi:CheY-like chemotaxis protein
MHYTILVVDDQPDNLQVLAALVADHGLQSRCVTNGVMAIRTSLARPPALVLLDIKMPGMDGYEVCRQLKADERTRSVPIIFERPGRDSG